MRRTIRSQVLASPSRLTIRQMHGKYLDSPAHPLEASLAGRRSAVQYPQILAGITVIADHRITGSIQH